MIKKNDLYNILKERGLPFDIHDHKALFSVSESERERTITEGAHTKNLFLKNKKNCFFLISCLENEKIDLKKIGKKLGIGNLSFAKENKLLEYLGVMPGSVSPFALLNDTKNSVIFYLDYKLSNYKKINFHPLINTSTITMETKLFINFLHQNNKKVNVYDIENFNLME